jgi:hypothetical protein
VRVTCHRLDSSCRLEVSPFLSVRPSCSPVDTHHITRLWRLKRRCGWRQRRRAHKEIVLGLLISAVELLLKAILFSRSHKETKHRSLSLGDLLHLPSWLSSIINCSKQGKGTFVSRSQAPPVQLGIFVGPFSSPAFRIISLR